ncbi:iron chelate uptake ABC transporter family permease subunit, partial [Acetobacter orientalis]|uniref:iron chelate uptake ABC transporter family permease subunit n=1 Tax=Acetobacter orientalis TaxID=146474 RepID=UPI0039E76AC4
MTPAGKVFWLNTVLLVAIFMLFVASLLWGESHLMVAETIHDMLAGHRSAGVIIVEQLRLPRAVLALVVGGVLGLAGAALQGYLRNPLADHGILGVSVGAALGAVCFFYTGLMQVSVAALPLGGLVGARCAVVLL